MTEENKDKKQNIAVSIDTARTEALARENERLKMEKEKGKPFDLAEKKLEMYQQTGEVRYLDCKSKEEMTELTTSLMRETVERRKGTPSGSPLTPQQLGEKGFDLYTHKWSSEKEMTDFLYDHYKEDTPLGHECDSYLTEMLRKWAHEFREQREQKFYNPNLKEHLPRTKEFHGFQVPEDASQGDISRILEKWRLQNPRIRAAKEAIERGRNPQERSSDA